jgi:hypothetical protein
VPRSRRGPSPYISLNVEPRAASRDTVARYARSAARRQDGGRWRLWRSGFRSIDRGAIENSQPIGTKLATSRPKFQVRMTTRRIAAFVAVVIAFTSYGAIAATFGLCHKAECCATSGQQMAAPPKCCNESACEAAPEVAEVVHVIAIAHQPVSVGAVAVLPPLSRPGDVMRRSLGPAIAPNSFASIIVLRI